MIIWILPKFNAKTVWMIVAQMIKKFLTLYGSWMFITVFTMKLKFSENLNQDQTLTLYLFIIHLILSSYFLGYLSPSDSATEVIMDLFYSPRLVRVYSSLFLHLITFIFGDKCKLQTSHFVGPIFTYFRYFSLRANNILSTLCWNI
jgi:hypothetical protein